MLWGCVVSVDSETGVTGACLRCPMTVRDGYVMCVRGTMERVRARVRGLIGERERYLASGTERNRNATRIRSIPFRSGPKGRNSGIRTTLARGLCMASGVSRHRLAH